MSVTERWTVHANPQASGFLREGVHASGVGTDAIKVGVTRVGPNGDEMVEIDFDIAEWREFVTAVELKLEGVQK